MDPTKAKTFLSALGPGDQALFLAYLSHELTVAARSYYSDEHDNAQRLIAAIKGTNEIQHRISAQLRYLLRGGSDQLFPTDALVDVLFAWAEAYKDEPVTGHLMHALDRSAQHLARYGKAARAQTY